MEKNDSLCAKLKETQKMVSQLEDDLQNLSSSFPMDINYKITQLRTLISRCQTKRASFVDEFEPEVVPPEFKDEKYFNKVSKETSEQVREAFKEIENEQNIYFDRYMRDHPGPYYTERPPTTVFPKEKLAKIKSMLSEEKNNASMKLQELERKVAVCVSSDVDEKSIEIEPMRKAMDQQQQQMEEIMLQFQELLLLINVEKSKQDNRELLEAEGKIDPIEKVKKDAIAQYEKVNGKIDGEAAIYNTITTTIANELDSIRTGLIGIQLKEQAINGSIARTSSILEKAKVKSSQISEKLDLYSTNVENAKEEREKRTENEAFIALKERCEKSETEENEAINRTKSIIDEVTEQIEGLTFRS